MGNAMEREGHDIGGVIVDNGPKDARSGYLVGYGATRSDGDGLTICPPPGAIGTFAEKVEELKNWLVAIGASGIFHWHVRTFSPGRKGLFLQGDSGQVAIALRWGMLWEYRGDWLMPLL